MNFRKNHVRSVSLALLTLFIVTGLAFQNSAFAQGLGMSMNVNADDGSSVISVSGQTTTLLNDITIVVTAPNGNIVSIDQVSPNLDGNYMADIQIGSLWMQDGWYIVSAQQGDSSLYKLSVQVEITGGAAMATAASESSLEFATSIVQPDDNQGGLTLTVDAPEGALAIGIGGSTDRTFTDITLIVTAPNGNVITVDQITPNQNGAFNSVIEVGCSSWEQDGFYIIEVQQGDSSFYKSTAEVEIKDCVVVPEFGTIAVMILAVAIVSIIAVTSRSRLSVMPKF
jgi:predicted secreted protein with PEFG-CTERM motif